MEDIIVIDNQEFLIIDKVNYLDKSYLYIIATDGSNKFSIVEEINKDDSTFIKSIDDVDLIEKILEVISKK